MLNAAPAMSTASAPAAMQVFPGRGLGNLSKFILFIGLAKIQGIRSHGNILSQRLVARYITF